jgi:hypothetical protein
MFVLYGLITLVDTYNFRLLKSLRERGSGRSFWYGAWDPRWARHRYPASGSEESEEPSRCILAWRWGWWVAPRRVRQKWLKKRLVRFGWYFFDWWSLWWW